MEKAPPTVRRWGRVPPRAPGFECHVETDGIMRKEDGPIRHKENGAVRFRCPCPEPVVVTSPSILTYTKEPHLRSSNLNFFSPTIGVRFSFSAEREDVTLQPVQKKRPGGESAPLPGLSTGLPWLYFLCRAVSVWFPRRRNSINPTPKSVNAANTTVGADTPVLASWRIVFTMAGVAGGM